MIQRPDLNLYLEMAQRFSSITAYTAHRQIPSLSFIFPFSPCCSSVAIAKRLALKRQTFSDEPTCKKFARVQVDNYDETDKLPPLTQDHIPSIMSAQETEINQREAEVYDRQIRLWGVEAQKRMRSSYVLIAGLSGVNIEHMRETASTVVSNLDPKVCKNLVLAGVNVTIQDERPAAPNDLAAQFFLRSADIQGNKAEKSYERVKELNPLIAVDFESRPLSSLTNEFFSKFSIVCVSSCPQAMQFKINQICRDLGIGFLYTTTYGLDGLMFMDLINHTFRRSAVGEGKISDPITLRYDRLQDSLRVKWSSLKKPGRRGRHVSRVFMAYNVLQKFWANHGRLPDPAHGEDLSSLKAMADELTTLNEVPRELVDDDYLRQLHRSATAEIAPVCAVIGGIIGQEITKAISTRDETINNWFFLDSSDGSGRVCRITA